MKSKAHAPAIVPYKPGAARGFVNTLRQRGRIGFSIDDVAAATHLSAVAARRQLARLAPLVTRVTPRQAFCLIVDPEHQPLGAPPPAWWLDAYFTWLRRPYYLALQSAAAEYGSAAQALQVAQVMTDKPRRDIQLGRVRVRFFAKSDLAATPIRAAADAFAPLKVSSPEATVLDLVHYASRIGGIERAAETLQPLLPQLKASRLAVATLGAETPTLQRLGFVLEAFGHARLARAVHSHLPSTAVKPVLLRVGAAAPSTRRAALNTRWSVINNASVR
jgi:AbiEi antitoxin C-terminal domain